MESSMRPFGLVISLLYTKIWKAAAPEGIGNIYGLPPLS